jgi:hypothetical protein
MLRIRPEQLLAFSAAARETLARRLAEHVREAFAQASDGSAADEELVAVLRGAIGRANAFGFESDRDIATYVDVQFAIGAPPESRAWGAAILNEASLPPGHRAHLLFTRAVERLDQGDV